MGYHLPGGYFQFRRSLFKNDYVSAYLANMKLSFENTTCPVRLKASRDALEIITGKWRVPIIISLTYGVKRFGEIQLDIADISAKMLSKELKILEQNELISRTINESVITKVEYELTPLGKSLSNLLDELLAWGIHFRQEIIKKK